MTPASIVKHLRAGRWSLQLVTAGQDGASHVVAEVQIDDAPGIENAYLWAAAPQLRDALFYAMHALEDANEGYFCECEDCEQCGKPVDECTGTECSKTCQCSSCRYCVTEAAYEGAQRALAASRPPELSEARRGGDATEAEDRANARLVAAAPLMHAALEAEEAAQWYYAASIGGLLDEYGRELCKRADQLRREALAASRPPELSEARRGTEQ